MLEAIIKTKNGKAVGPSGIDIEMLNPSGDTGVRLVADLANDMTRNGTIPSDWENIFIINIYKGKGDALIRGYYSGLKLLDHVKKGIESDGKDHQGKEYSSMTCSLASCQDGAQLMQYSSLGSCKKNIWLRTGICTSLSLPLNKYLMEYQEKLFGGSCRNLALRNGLYSLYRLYTTTPEVKLESITPTLMN